MRRIERRIGCTPTEQRSNEAIELVLHGGNLLPGLRETSMRHPRREHPLYFDIGFPVKQDLQRERTMGDVYSFRPETVLDRDSRRENSVLGGTTALSSSNATPFARKCRS